MELFTSVNRNLNLIKSAKKNASSKYHALLYPELIATIKSTGLTLICINSNYLTEDGIWVDFSFYYHPLKIIVLNFETVNNKQLEPFWGKDFRLAYNLILVHEIGHYISFNHNDFSENSAWMQGLNLAEYLKLFPPELVQLFQNYFIV
jgi:hypothetical protein